MTNKPSALSANDFDVLIARAEREIAIRRSVVESESGSDGSPTRRRKAVKEIKDYEAHLENQKQHSQEQPRRGSVY